jgi:hypothetical protein
MLEIRKSRKVRDGVKLLKQLADDLVGVFALAQALDLFEGPHERLLGLADGDVGVVLALPLETLLMFEDFPPEEIG